MLVVVVVVLAVFQGEEGEAGQRVLPLRRRQIVLAKPVEEGGSAVVPRVSVRGGVEVGRERSVRRSLRIPRGGDGDERCVGVVRRRVPVMRRGRGVLDFDARRFPGHRVGKDTRRLRDVVVAEVVHQEEGSGGGPRGITGERGAAGGRGDLAVGQVHAVLDELRREEVPPAAFSRRGSLLRRGTGALGRRTALGLDARHGHWENKIRVIDAWKKSKVGIKSISERIRPIEKGYSNKQKKASS